LTNENAPVCREFGGRVTFAPDCAAAVTARPQVIAVAVMTRFRIGEKFP